jgi:DNA-binding transcriptional regulator YiaG
MQNDLTRLDQRGLSRRELQRLTLIKQAPTVISGRLSKAQVSRFVRSALKVTGMTPPQMARQLGVAPQTVNRWVRGVVQPRPGQIDKVLAILQEKNGIEQSRTSVGIESVNGQHEAQDEYHAGPVAFSEAAPRLGIHFTDSVMGLEGEARDVWIIKCGPLREADGGFMAAAVLRALRAGTHFHYLFLPGSAAEETFLHYLKPWLEEEDFTGKVTGYVMRDLAQAARVGLSSTPGAWVVIEYSTDQARRLQRDFDVFKALAVREYMDATRRHIKNEDGQPCWLELATPQAKVWIAQLRHLRAAAKSAGETKVDLIRVISRTRRMPRMRK